VIFSSGLGFDFDSDDPRILQAEAKK